MLFRGRDRSLATDAATKAVAVFVAGSCPARAAAEQLSATEAPNNDASTQLWPRVASIERAAAVGVATNAPTVFVRASVAGVVPDQRPNRAITFEERGCGGGLLCAAEGVVVSAGADKRCAWLSPKEFCA